MKKYHSFLEPLSFYHIYNRAIGSENLFREEKNYSFFLNKWNKYILNYTNIWAYILMPNHFHFLIRVKNTEVFQDHIEPNSFLEDQFKRLFSSYTLAFNKMYDRTGSLFQKSFKRVHVDSRNYLKHLIHYIHHNPIHHNFVEDYHQWPYSSYQAVLSDKPTRVNRDGVLRLFGSKKRFQSIHKQQKDYKKISHLLVE